MIRTLLNSLKMMELDDVAYNLITSNEYLEILDKAGFSKITYHDTTSESVDLSKQNVDTIRAIESKTSSRYDRDTFYESLNSWSWQKDAFRSRELATGIFRAKKSLSG